MTKNEFLDALKAKLSGLPECDIEEHISFYSEMIDDRIEDGVGEEEAVFGIGSVDEIAAQIIANVPLTRIAKEKIRPKRRLRAWEIVLLAVGSPIWLSLGIAAFAVILALYVVLWSLIISLWAVFVSLVACALGLTVASVEMIGGPYVFAGVIMADESHVFTGIALIGVALVCAGLGIFLFFGCNAATKGAVMLTKVIASGIKKAFVGKEKI
jgi:uncharacterized membrane protein